MKTLIGALAAVFALAGCVAVPVAEPVPAYGYYYSPPAATFSFGYHHDRHRGHRHHRHRR
jgi:hypothetical protein